MELDQKLKHYRMSRTEYEKASELLGHELRGVEWALFSALWSEHCSYKSSKIHLRKFSYRNSRILDAEGENAGVVDLGQDERVAFKMESHNHPSFLEPFQGAATGVGGILRDIFTMGARPIALADYLCFGDTEAHRMKTLISGVVKGIGGYGNCVGVATVTGQTEFHSSYNTNILVNAMAIGLIEKDMPMALSRASGPGNWVVYVGAKTGRDGVHGASMASESFSDDTDSKKPNVQIGDPFFEKLLIEACLEALATGTIVAMQDMGAAGLTSSSFEMSARGGVGLRLDLGKVPVRDSSITAEEILLSESQERMLLIVKPADFDKIEKIFQKWGLDACVLGEVTQDPQIEIMYRGEILTKILPSLIVDQAPRYDRPVGIPRKQGQATRLSEYRSTFSNVERVFDLLVENPAFQDKRAIYRQYDQRVGARTAKDCSESTALLRLPSGRGLGVAVGCRPQLMRMDPDLGAWDSVFYPALQLAAKGVRAVAITDCLNFGNPEKPEIMAEFVTSVENIAMAAEKLDAPVISGNVSFYNETFGQNITSTPATGIVGLKESGVDAPQETLGLGERLFWLRSSNIVKVVSHTAEVLDLQKGFEGQFQVDKAVTFVRQIEELANQKSVRATKVVGQGGLFWTLVKMSTPEVGLRVSADWLKGLPPEEAFSEDMYSVVFAVDQAEAAEFAKMAAKLSLTLHEIGGTLAKEFHWGQELKQSSQELFDRRREVTWL